MSRSMKIGVVAFLGIAGLAVLALGIFTQLYSLSVSAAFAVFIWIIAVLVYILARERKPSRGATRTITDSGCRDALTRK